MVLKIFRNKKTILFHFILTNSAPGRYMDHFPHLDFPDPKNILIKLG